MINATTQFIEAMLASIGKVFIKLELMDRDENVIDVFEHQVDANSIGDISVNADRDIQRMFTLSLDNHDGYFTWQENGLIWIDNKRVKVYIGLETPSGIEYVPQGVFIITQPEAVHKPLQNIVNISGQDKWYLLTGNFGRFTHETTVQKGTNIKNAIKILLEGAGITKMILEDCDIVLPYDMTFQIGQNRGQAIKDLCEKAYSNGEFFYSVYFDVNGYFRFEKYKDPLLEAPVWTYKIDDSTLYAGSSRKLDDTELYNHILVLGGSSQTAEFRHEIIIDDTKDEWKGHPYSIQKIGDRFHAWNDGNPDSNIDTLAQCKARATFELNKRLSYSEVISFDHAPNYLHEAHDVISVEDDKNGCIGNYQLKSFSIPIRPKIVTSQAIKIRKGLV